MQSIGIVNEGGTKGGLETVPTRPRRCLTTPWVSPACIDHPGGRKGAQENGSHRRPIFRTHPTQ